MSSPKSIYWGAGVSIAFASYFLSQSEIDEETDGLYIIYFFISSKFGVSLKQK